MELITVFYKGTNYIVDPETDIIKQYYADLKYIKKPDEEMTFATIAGNITAKDFLESINKKNKIKNNKKNFKKEDNKKSKIVDKQQKKLDKHKKINSKSTIEKNITPKKRCLFHDHTIYMPSHYLSKIAKKIINKQEIQNNQKLKIYFCIDEIVKSNDLIKTLILNYQSDLAYIDIKENNDTLTTIKHPLFPKNLEMLLDIAEKYYTTICLSSNKEIIDYFIENKLYEKYDLNLIIPNIESKEEYIKKIELKKLPSKIRYTYEKYWDIIINRLSDVKVKEINIIQLSKNELEYKIKN